MEQSGYDVTQHSSRGHWLGGWDYNFQYLGSQPSYVWKTKQGDFKRGLEIVIGIS